MGQDNQTGFENKNDPIREKLLKWLPESGEYQTPVNGFFLFRNVRKTVSMNLPSA